VHGYVGLARQESLFDFLHEQPFAPNCGQAAILNAVAGRSNEKLFNLDVGVG
jgi:hypothetical protein